MTLMELLTKNGYTAEGYTHCLVGANTYEMREHLKETGHVFDRTLGWHTATPLSPVPDSFVYVTIYWADVVTYDEPNDLLNYKVDALETFYNAYVAVAGEPASQHMGEVKERLRNLSATITKKYDFNTIYGTKTCYNFKVGDNILAWFTATVHDVNVGDEISLTGTVKEHTYFNNEKVTVLSRCVFK